MRLLRMSFTRVDAFVKRRYNSEQYAEWVITEAVDNYKLMYAVDTWYLPDFERILLGIVDYTEQPSTWKSINRWILYLGDEIQFFVIYFYMIFITTKSLSFIWQWHGWTEKQILSTYNWGVYLEDIQTNVNLDKSNTKLLSTYLFNFNSENTTSVVWETINYDLFFFFTTRKQTVYNNAIDQNCFILDSLFSRYSRFSFKVALQSVFYFFTQLFFVNSLTSYTTRTLDWIGDNSKIADLKVYTFKNTTFTAINNCSLIFARLRKNNIAKLFSMTYTKFLLKPVVFSNTKDINVTASMLRKQRVFTKSKYSRSRQYCKNIVFMGLLLNIILVFGLNSGYYAILMNAGYFILPVYAIMFLYSVFIFFKFKLYNFFNIVC